MVLAATNIEVRETNQAGQGPERNAPATAAAQGDDINLLANSNSTRTDHISSYVKNGAIDMALAYAEAGWTVFPCGYGTKVPATNRGFYDGTTNVEAVKAAFSKGTFNVGIATGKVSNLVAIDEDTYKGGDLSLLEGELGTLPPTREARTRAGGRHLLFGYPEGYELGCFNGKIAAHIDLKADGGYVIAAPSFVDADEKGPAGTYQWVNDLPLASLPNAWCERWAALGRRNLAELPPNQNTRNELGSPKYRVPERVETGQRNSELLRYASHLRANGMPEQTILEAARDFNRARMVEPLGDDEVVDIVGRYARTDSGEADQWPVPKSIHAPLPEVKEFDLKLLPDAFVPAVEDQSDLMQIAPDFIAAPLMVAAAAAIGNTVVIAPKEHDFSWQVSTVLWGGIVGRPGVLKSPALDRATNPLLMLEQQMASSFDARRQSYILENLVYEQQLATAKKAIKAGGSATIPLEPEEPQPERLIVNDTTTQKLGEVLRYSPRGVLVVRDELVSLLESVSAEGQEGARGFLLEGWNGLNAYRVDRIGRGSFIIPNLAIYLLGGIQPSKLQSYVRQATVGGGGDDGLLQRFQLIVWPDVGGDWRNVDRSPNTEAKLAVDEAFLRLRAITATSIGAIGLQGAKNLPYLHFTSEAQEIFNEFRQKLELSLRTGEKHPALESHLSKFRSLVPALALVIHLADGGTGPVTRRALTKAIGWSNYLWSHARRVYASATNASAFGAKALAEKIGKQKLSNGFTARDIHRNGWAYLSTVEDVRQALDWLVDAGWLRVAPSGNGGGCGRPTDRYEINPAVAALNGSS